MNVVTGAFLDVVDESREDGTRIGLYQATSGVNPTLDCVFFSQLAGSYVGAQVLAGDVGAPQRSLHG